LQKFFCPKLILRGCVKIRREEKKDEKKKRRRRRRKEGRGRGRGKGGGDARRALMVRR